MAFRKTTFYSGYNPAGRDHNKATFVYRTDDDLATITAPGYFDYVIGRLEIGDIIEVQFVEFESETNDKSVAEQGSARLSVVYHDGTLMHVMQLLSNQFLLTATMTDVSTAGGALGAAATDGNADVTANVAGTVLYYQTLLGGAITGGDAAITSGNDTDSQAFTGGAATIANAGSEEGDIDTSTEVTLDGEFVAGDVIRLISDGGSTGVQPLYCFIVCQEA